MRKIRFMLIALMCLGIAACATNPQNQESQYGNGSNATGENSELLQNGGGMTTSVLGNDQQNEGEGGLSLDNPNSLLAQRVFYFDFDSSDIAADYMPALSAHAEYLNSHPGARVRLEGNTDERGTREYNLALGERRAKAVKQVLVLKGVPANQITTVSYGEEKPAADGHDEAAWSKNRRVVLVYTSK